jgi:penicillin amidase
MANAWLPVPGWTGAYEWRGDIPFAEMSRMRNPENGFIVTANNRISDENYPYYIALNYVPEFRARRIWNRLSEMTSATVESMQSVHAERISMPAKVLSKLIAQLDPADDFLAKARAKIADWDCAMDPDDAAPTIYSAFRIKLLKRFVEHLVGPLCEEMFTATGRGAPRHLGELAVRMAAMVKNDDVSMLPPGETWRSMADNAFDEAVWFLRARFGADMEAWRWATVHRTCPKHPLSERFPEFAAHLNPPSMGMGGDGDTPLAAGFSPGKPFGVTLLSVLRYVYDTADWDNSGWAVPLGVSGHPASPHYADQSDAWGSTTLVPMLYSWGRIIEEAETHQVLSPQVKADGHA